MATNIRALINIKMAEEETTDSRINQNNDNIFEILQKETSVRMTLDTFDGEPSENGNDILFNPKGYRNLPGLHVSHAAHVAKEDKNKQSDTSVTVSSDVKRPKITHIPSTHIPDPCVSPDTGKRRRIQHDYRRLSNSGYLVDYVGSERRFSSTSDSSEISSSPSPPKQKQQQKSPNGMNGTVKGIQFNQVGHKHQIARLCLGCETVPYCPRCDNFVPQRRDNFTPS